MLELRTIPNNQAVFVTLSDMPLHRVATVESVQDRQPNDTIARRLRELGFVAGKK